jgi:hypothetical protein
MFVVTKTWVTDKNEMAESLMKERNMFGQNLHTSMVVAGSLASRHLKLKLEFVQGLALSLGLGSFT